MDLNINVNIDWKEANRLVDKLLKGFMSMSSLLSGQVVKQQSDVITIVDDLSEPLKEVVTEQDTTGTNEMEMEVSKEKLYSCEEVRKALGDLMHIEGKDVAKSILNKFNATKFSDVSEEQYSALMEDIKAVR